MAVNYREKRDAFFSALREPYWDTLYGSEYSLFDAFGMSKREQEKIGTVAKRAYHILMKAAKYVAAKDDGLLTELDFDRQTHSFIKSSQLEPAITRVDLVRTIHGDYRVLELNSDTPTFIKECFSIGDQTCKALRHRGMNFGQEERLKRCIQKAIQQAAFSIGKPVGDCHIMFSANGESIEDSETSKYLCQLANLGNARYCHLEELTIDKNGVYDEHGKKVDILYRQTYPIEYLVHDYCHRTKVNVGELLLDHAVRGKVVLINPPLAFLMQSKGLQVIVWMLYENQQLYSLEERRWIEDYFLPTDFSPEWLQEQELEYVEKPMFGREGDTVTIYDEFGRVMIGNKARNYTDSTFVYQEYCELPRTKAQTLAGEKQLFYIVGAFLLHGEPSAIGLRCSEGMITDNLSYFLPVYMESL